MSSRVCLCLTESTLTRAARALDSARGLADMAELRADFLDPGELGELASFAASRPEDMILTVRRRAEGGTWSGTEAERAALIRRSLSTRGFRYVDLEEGFDPPAVRETLAGVRVIRSVYDCAGVPEGLDRRLADLGRGGEIAKVAVTPRGCTDLARLLEAAGLPSRPGPCERIIVGMGEHGFPTQVLASRLGSWLTYGSVEANAAAPGQITPRELEELYRFGSISPSTQLLAVIGNPIAHSRSPAIHNAGLAALGLNAVYVPFLVDDVAGFLRVADLLGITGVSVTVPHKESVLGFLARRDAGVGAVGACNTLVREASGWFGTNTDVEGFLAPLERRGFRLGESTRATVIGAGGAARAVVYALRRAGAAVLILNRTRERAEGLAKQFGCAAGPIGAEGARLIADYRDLVVQTSVWGMEPNDGCDPMPEYGFRGTELVYELVYRPPVTPFVARAAAAGCSWIGGMDMLLEQAYAQFELFVGRRYPAELKTGESRWGQCR